MHMVGQVMLRPTGPDAGLVFARNLLIGSGDRREQGFEIIAPVEPVAVDRVPVGRDLAGTFPIAQSVHRDAEKLSCGFDLKEVVNVHRVAFHPI